MWSPVTKSGLPLLRTLPLLASTAQSAPLTVPGVVQPPLPFDVQGVPRKTTPPSVTVGAERGTVFEKDAESGPNAACQAIDVPQLPMAARPGASIELPLPADVIAP